jgi:hypothetical protein
MISSIPPQWAGETAVIIAGGPSVPVNLIARLRGKVRVIAINDSWRLAPWADVLYFCDAPWYRRNLNEIQERFTGRYVVTIAEDRFPGVTQLRCSGALGLDQDPGSLRHGNNSGYQAIHLAYHFGASRIVLVGYDMHANGRNHWHNRDAGRDSKDFNQTLQLDMLPCFEYLKQPLLDAGVTVVNASPNSALKVWPYRNLLELV